MRTNCVELAEKFVKEHLSGYDSGHDWWHITRVRDMALHIHEVEKKGNRLLIELAALLHDIGDSKFRKDNEPDPGAVISEFLKTLDIDNGLIEEVVRINSSISFSSGDKTGTKSIEFMIVQDADRLDAIGATGIARAFSYGGFRNRPLFEPDADQFNGGPGKGTTTIAHFYEKLLLLKDMMNTRTGKRVAAGRHRYIERFLERFFDEWNMKR